MMAGLSRAQTFYSEMKETVSSLQKNVETFVNNRRSEGGQLLSKIEQSKTQGADQEQQRLKNLMDRMSIDPSHSPTSSGSGSGTGRKKSIPTPLGAVPSYSQSGPGHPAYNPATSPPTTPHYPANMAPGQQAYMSRQSYATNSSNGFQQQGFSQFSSPQQQQQSRASVYNPALHNQYQPTSPPAHQQFFSPPPLPNQHQPWGAPPGQQQQQQQQQQQWGGGAAQPNLPQGYIPPPPPPGPPPSQNMDFSHFSQGGYPSGPGGYASAPRQPSQQHQQQQQGGNDPWAGLSGWK